MTAREIEAALKRWKDPFGHILKLFVRIWTNDNLNKLRKKCLINAIDLHLMHSSNLLRRLNELVTSGTRWIHWLQSNKLNLWNGVEFNAYRAWCVSEDNCSYGFKILIVDVQIYPDFFVFVYSQWIPYQRMVWLAFAYSDGIVMHWLWLIRNAHLIHIYIYIYFDYGWNQIASHSSFTGGVRHYVVVCQKRARILPNDWCLMNAPLAHS